MLYIVVVIQYWHHLISIVVHINGKAQVWLALIRLMLICRADPSVFVSIAPSEGVWLFEHRTHRVMSRSHLTFIWGRYFIITHVAPNTLLSNLLFISFFIERLMVDRDSFVLKDCLSTLTFVLCHYSFPIFVNLLELRSHSHLLSVVDFASQRSCFIIWVLIAR